MAQTFYNVKTRAKEEVEETNIKKRTYVNAKTGRTSYAIRAVGSDGTNMTKFVSKDTYDALEVPVEE